jgi:hypothetical protein
MAFKKIEDLLKETLPTLQGQAKTTTQYSLTLKQKRYTIRLFKKMERLYPIKWTSANGEPVNKDNSGNITGFSDSFIEWAHETKDLTDEQWIRVFKVLEKEIADNAINGKDSWAPPYPSFVAIAKRTSPDGINSKAYQIFDRSKALEQKPSKYTDEHRKHNAAMREIFPDIKLTDYKEEKTE